MKKLFCLLLLVFTSVMSFAGTTPLKYIKYSTNNNNRATNHTIQKNIVIGNIHSFLSDIAFANDSFALVNTGLHNVMIIDAIKNNLVTTIDIGLSPRGITFGNNQFAVTNPGSKFVSIIDVASNYNVTDVAQIPQTGTGEIAFAENRFIVPDGAIIDAITSTIISQFAKGIHIAVGQPQRFENTDVKPSFTFLRKSQDKRKKESSSKQKGALLPSPLEEAKEYLQEEVEVMDKLIDEIFHKKQD